jgi:soluble lytic murein transglycosylase-like protein
MRCFKRTATLAIIIVALSAEQLSLSSKSDNPKQDVAIAQDAAAIPDPTATLTWTPTPTILPTKAPSTKTYNIPLSARMQRYTYRLCRKNGLDIKTVLALMKTESNYKADKISSTEDYGIMQINKINHVWIKSKYGISDLMNPKQNILAGVKMLAKLKKKYGDSNKVLMAYNMGESGARKLWRQGITSSRYSRRVISKAAEIKSMKGDENK